MKREDSTNFQAQLLLSTLSQAVKTLSAQAASPQTQLIPGLPAYCTKGNLQQLVTVLSRAVSLAGGLGVNPVVFMRGGLLQVVKPALLLKLHTYLKYVALIFPSATPGNKSHAFLKQVISIGSRFPALGLKLATTGLKAYGQVRHVPPTVHKLLHDLLKLKLSNSQLSVVLAHSRVLAKYAPYLLGSASSSNMNKAIGASATNAKLPNVKQSNTTRLPPGDGADLMQAVEAILACLTELQVQTLCAICLQLLSTYQPSTLQWFTTLNVTAVRKYLCKMEFQLQGEMCAFRNSVNNKRNNLKSVKNRTNIKL